MQPCIRQGCYSQISISQLTIRYTFDTQFDAKTKKKCEIFAVNRTLKKWLKYDNKDINNKDKLQNKSELKRDDNN